MERATVAPAVRAIILMLVAVAGGSALVVNKTIESDDGDVIDCVHVYHKSALKHPSPGTTTRQFQATNPERNWNMTAMAAAAAAALLQARPQTWAKHGSCPSGTVPIRRASPNANPEVVQRALRASPFQRPGAGKVDFPESMDTKTGKVEVAAAYACNAPYLGARAHIPHWEINVHSDEFSMNYLLIGYTLDSNFSPFPGHSPPDNLPNQIAVGLVAWPSLFGDSSARLFVYYTNDGGVNNNCFNLDCGGFQVQPSPYALGTGWSPSSQLGGDRYGVPVSIHRDATEEKWLVSVMGHDIGYYPESVFNTRFPEAFYVEMGGRVLDTRSDGKHTTTPMGSGMPTCTGGRFAATATDYYAVNYNGVLSNDWADRTVVTTPGCYDAKPLGFDQVHGGYVVLYGGPGGIYCDN